MTALPSWDASYATGNSLIDGQHRELLAFVKQLEEVDGTDRSRFFSVLDQMMEFCWIHFDVEERLMDRVHYPAQDHIEMTRQHTEFKDYARIRVLEFRFHETTSLEDFVPFLHDWLVDHEFGLDRKLATFIRVTKQAAAVDTAQGNGH